MLLKCGILIEKLNFVEAFMTELLSEAFKKAASMPEDIQNALAAELLEEIEWEKQWNNTLVESVPMLEQLGNRALREFKEGKTREMGFDEL